MVRARACQATRLLKYERLYALGDALAQDLSYRRGGNVVQIDTNVVLSVPFRVYVNMPNAKREQDGGEMRSTTVKCTRVRR
jgi:hypothetical protein